MGRELGPELGGGPEPGIGEGAAMGRATGWWCGVKRVAFVPSWFRCDTCDDAGMSTNRSARKPVTAVTSLHRLRQ